MIILICKTRSTFLLKIPQWFLITFRIKPTAKCSTWPSQGYQYCDLILCHSFLGPLQPNSLSVSQIFKHTKFILYTYCQLLQKPLILILSIPSPYYSHTYQMLSSVFSDEITHTHVLHVTDVFANTVFSFIALIHISLTLHFYYYDPPPGL